MNRYQVVLPGVVTCQLAFFAFCVPVAGQHAERTSDVRQTIELAEGWRFFQGEFSDAQEVGFDDSQWATVRVPHDWSIEGPFAHSNPAGGDGAFLPTGVSWYRLPLPDQLEIEGRRVFVEFDGVMANSDVWINGQHMGHRPNGYVTFRYDLTEFLHDNPSANVLTVRADTQQQVASRWYTGTGIYRKARLVSVHPVGLRDRDTYVTTRPTAGGGSTVQVETTAVNETQQRQIGKLEVRLVAPNGQHVASQEQEIALGANAAESLQASLEVPKPQHWDIGRGHLYKAELELSVDGETLDRTSTRFGIRQVRFESETGFWINDRNVKLKGVCLHHDGGAFGAAVPKSVWQSRLATLQELGVNAIRTAHNPPSPDLLDLCDELGILVMNEFFDCWMVGKRPFDYHLHFEEWAHRDLEDTIRRDRNHPCVVLYSVGNEIRDTHKPEQAKDILAGLVDVCHLHDPTRPVTQGLFRPNTTHDYNNGLADLLDVIGTNYRDAELLDAWRDQPGRRIVGTEQGHDRSTWLACHDNPQHAGQFLWVGVDYLGESRRWPVNTFDTGLIDRTGRIYPRGYERQSWWSDYPMVRIYRRVAPTAATPTDPGYELAEWVRPKVLFDDWTPQGGTDGKSQNIEVYSNCEVVRLELNDESLGSQKLPEDAGPRTWKVPFEAGRLVAIGLDEDSEVARHELRTAGPPAGLLVTSDQEHLEPKWDSVAKVQVQLVDSAGMPCPTGSFEISFSVEGAGELVAVDNGSIVSVEPFQATRRQLFEGRCVAYVRATEPNGDIRVIANSTQIAAEPVAASVKITAKP